MRRVVLVAMVGGWMLACGAGDAADGGEAVAELAGLEAGDVACYVVLKADGEELYLEGDFELCPGGGSDASGLIGKKVRYTTTTAQVMAGSCEGDPECTDTEEVPLVLTVVAAE